MRYLHWLVFTAGAATLGMELSASRLLEPVFGNNQLVWAALIGLILLYLALGAWLGGRLADRFPQRRALDLTAIAAALGVALAPTLSPPILRLAATGIDNFAPGLLLGSCLAILCLFSIPGILLGTISPWVVRLSITDLQQSGKIAGRISAIATAGSLLGSFLPVLWLIPAYGTRWAFFLLALGLLLVVAIGTLRHAHRWVAWLAIGLVLLLAWSTQSSGVRAAWDSGQQGELIYEDESFYNYIGVRQWGSERHLKLNDGVGIHSVYHPDSALSLGIWDYFLLAPFFRPPEALACSGGAPPCPPSNALDNLLLIGLAAGTISELYSNFYGPLPITGVELDPQIIEVGQRYFGMDQPNLTAIAADGRRWLMQQPATTQWDVIAIDAYRPPYIPFHLATVEFFTLVREHLTEDGVVAINVGRTASNFALVDALAATLATVFPAVYAIDEPGPADTLGNTLVIAAQQPVSLAQVQQAAAGFSGAFPPEVAQWIAEAIPRTRPLTPPIDAPRFTDDHTPVEWVVHRIIWDFLTQRSSS